MKKIKFNVEGMHCASCAQGIEFLLESKKGVKEIRVDYNTKTAKIEFDKEKISEKEIIDSVKELGYKLKKK